MNNRDDLSLEAKQELDDQYKYLRQAKSKMKQLAKRFNTDVINLRNQISELEKSAPGELKECRQYIETLNKLNIQGRSNKMSRIITDMVQTEHQINKLEKEYDNRINPG